MTATFLVQDLPGSEHVQHRWHCSNKKTKIYILLLFWSFKRRWDAKSALKPRGFDKQQARKHVPCLLYWKYVKSSYVRIFHYRSIIPQTELDWCLLRLLEYRFYSFVLWRVFFSFFFVPSLQSWESHLDWRNVNYWMTSAQIIILIKCKLRRSWSC